VPRLPRVKTERLPEGLHGNTVLSAASIVKFYAIIQQAVYGRTTLRPGRCHSAVHDHRWELRLMIKPGWVPGSAREAGIV
jgi:hypothetical protein